MEVGGSHAGEDDGELAVVRVQSLVLTSEGVRRRLSTEVAKTASVSEYCRLNGLSEDFVRQVISGRKPPGGKILVALGLERQVFYKIVDGRSTPAKEGSDPVLGDPEDHS